MYDLIIRNLAMHISLNAEEAEHVKTLLQYKTVKRNTVLLQSGDICRFIYFVNKGCLRIFNTDDNGDEHNINFGPENWWVVDISSFSTQTPAFYTIGALEVSELLYLSYTAFERLCIHVRSLNVFFAYSRKTGFIFTSCVTGNLSQPAEERYMHFQQLYAGLEQRISQKHIASYLGIHLCF